MDLKPVDLKRVIKNHAQPLTAAMIFLLAYTPTLMWMWSRWFATDSYYSHGILIPFVSGYLIWQKKAELQVMPVKESRLGMPLIVAGILLYLFSALFRINFSGGLSMFVVIFGMILHFYGMAILKKILFPIAFLIFMFPLPEVAIVNISFRMKIFAAEIAEKLLNQMGILAKRNGSIIMMRHAQVVVDDVCSGLRSLISLTALGSIFAFWLNGPAWKRVVLFLTTIPIAIITNVCRVVFLATVSEIWGPESAVGFIHDASGFLIFALAFVLLLGVSKAIE
ncbi:MAG TPA: exosortase/archaeosortase family protein [Candidatus Omnitrophota bacterium]|nr:exosortase/archaeosortase family protein [Candidatus Omnitrophota bacterium]